KGLARAMDSGELKRADPELLAYALLGIADFVATRYVIWGDGLTEAKIDQLVEMILHGLVADGGGNGESSPTESAPPVRRRRPARSRR
ncbi:MAG TPA: TetR/AcrR family transcriptional regulator, partial [Thermoplasmata archaeon]|nr:TetR/AcrR family transcriptional regulator [Thermoplasmata archaeon]